MSARSDKLRQYADRALSSERTAAAIYRVGAAIVEVLEERLQTQGPRIYRCPDCDPPMPPPLQDVDPDLVRGARMEGPDLQRRHFDGPFGCAWCASGDPAEDCPPKPAGLPTEEV